MSKYLRIRTGNDNVVEKYSLYYTLESGILIEKGDFNSVAWSLPHILMPLSFIGTPSV